MSRNYYSLPDAEEDFTSKIKSRELFYNEEKI